MKIVINDECINCGTCESECPVSCIHEGDGKYVIDQKECTQCETCIGVCPTEAIVKE